MTPCINYIYAHSDTVATTGYFRCVPENDPDLASSLRMLADRPYDNFLHNYVLDKLLQLSPGEIAALDSPILTHLLGEVAAIRGGSAPGAGEDGPFSIYIALNSQWRQNKNFAQAWREHLQTGNPVPDFTPPEELDRIGESFKKHSPILKAEFGQAEKAVQPRIDPHLTVKKAQDALAKANLLIGPEMRHEATLSPIALLRKWRLSTKNEHGANAHTLSGEVMAYGKGLSLAQARASCLMEVVERASAYASVQKNGDEYRIGDHRLIKASPGELKAKNILFFHPKTPVDISDAPLHWIEGRDSLDRVVLVPAQAAYLFCNIDEPSIFENIGSTGLASGNTMAEAKLSALMEVIERDSQATTPWPGGKFFRIASRDEKLEGLLRDYPFHNIHIFFQDISTEIGVPAYRCLVQPVDGALVMATGAALNGKQAALSAMTETPWPYSWANPLAIGKPTRAMNHLPLRYLEDLPDYGTGSAQTDLQLMEKALEKMNHAPIYVSLGREDLGFPVIRAFLPGLEYSGDFDELNQPSQRLLARYAMALA